ncbi:hypothetical protein [Sphingomonas sp. Leaf242]|nr:hypothetical protein [Sphingomonas sp. Leaf242]
MTRLFVARRPSAGDLDRVLTRLREAADRRIWWTTAGAIADHVTTNGLAV